MSNLKFKSGGLGRGLGSLLGEDSVEDLSKENVQALSIEAIAPNRWQPRRTFSEESLAELASSIQEQGVLQPIIVRRQHDDDNAPPYELIAGERRWRASKQAGLIEIPALIKDLNDAQTLEIAILENVQRENLNPVDLARGYQRLMHEFDYNHATIGQKIGKSRMAITNALRLLKLPEEVLELLQKGQISAGHGRALLGLGKAVKTMIRFAHRIVEEGMTVREIEKLVQERAKKITPDKKTSAKSSNSRKDAGILGIEEKLADDLRTKVSITHRQGRGKLILEYSTLEELEEFADKLIK
ncbi:ParB/RepB/Spo0J family partition protein [Magnetococcales bacterium HHB-1]